MLCGLDFSLIGISKVSSSIGHGYGYVSNTDT